MIEFDVEHGKCSQATTISKTQCTHAFIFRGYLRRGKRHCPSAPRASELPPETDLPSRWAAIPPASASIAPRDFRLERPEWKISESRATTVVSKGDLQIQSQRRFLLQLLLKLRRKVDEVHPVCTVAKFRGRGAKKCNAPRIASRTPET